MSEDKLKLTLTRPALERLLGGDPEFEIQIKHAAAKELFEKYTDAILGPIIRQKVSEVLTTKSNRYPYKVEVNSEFKKAVDDFVNKMIKEHVNKFVEESLQKSIESEIERRIDLEIKEVVRKKVRDKLDKALRDD